MSAKELDRLEVIQRVSDSRMSQVKAGKLLGLTSRTGVAAVPGVGCRRPRRAG